MRTKTFFLPFSCLVLIFGTALSGEPAGRLANLDPGLQQALEHDAVCAQKAPSPETAVNTQLIVAGQREAGVIASPQDQCYCRKENCATYVYLKSGENYTLALSDNFASLHPMKVMSHGLPSLSGKFQVDEAREETTIFDWTGKEYQPSLCASVMRRPGQRVPTIAKHQCRTSARIARQP